VNFAMRILEFLIIILYIFRGIDMRCLQGLWGAGSGEIPRWRPAPIIIRIAGHGTFGKLYTGRARGPGFNVGAGRGRMR
jgi:hypothetical protein